MVTARSPLRTRRAHPRGVAARLFWLGALLIAVFTAHGFGAENGAGHIDPIRIVFSAQTPAAGDTAPPSRHQENHPEHGQEHDEDADHPGGDCLSGKPEDGPGAETTWPAVTVLPATGEAAPAPGPAGPPAGSAEAGTPELPHRIANLRV
ncbi:hypothetical protein [Streptomyces sp. CBMA156]|uniref:hypothetical protein n=1 Tax=Streptomyces sp. CBMA156 TaxID=1930280 RepID=UPI0016619591|nr:hypothetical protein [Streptomyces sp. CBMA156]